MVLELEDVVHTKANKLCALVADKFKKNEEVDIHHGFRAISVDIISDYAFGECYNPLDRLISAWSFSSWFKDLVP